MTREAANLTPSHSGWQPESEASSRGAAAGRPRSRPGPGPAWAQCCHSWARPRSAHWQPAAAQAAAGRHRHGDRRPGGRLRVRLGP